MKTMLRLGKDRDALSIVGDQYGGPTYAGDIACALVEMIEQLSEQADSSKYGVYHFSGSPHVSWFEFAKLIFAEAEKASMLTAPELSSITTDMYPTPASRPENSKMNCAKIKQVFGIGPSNWQAALTDIKAYTG
ncbi:dTDP-4-dehydrorhamnose reductase [Vibrio ishigakensis]|uniref:dTDP-4-dehydrorhamnose reductase n=1 Tax=Vibrio ishigakensis TaxID=1481914 RepID=A0A0B8P980_9VIBR|nr:dTDP-4-dehydrorhamnose reductase [Vibrio ishigakensis]